VQGSKGVYPGLEFCPDRFWADPNADAIVDVAFVQGKAGLEVSWHGKFMDGEIQGGVDTGYGSAHCCAGKLPAKSNAKFEYIPSHDQSKAGDDGIGRDMPEVAYPTDPTACIRHPFLIAKYGRVKA
jgi:hypothetical protein